jgi:hypothetical protein
MASYEFRVDKQRLTAEWQRPGKPEWPDSVTLCLTRRRALALAQRLIDEYLASEVGAPCASPVKVSVCLHGELQDEEGFPVSSGSETVR